MDKLITAKMADAVFTKDGLIPVVVQDESTHEVLMVAYMNRATLAQTIETGTMTYWSRSRKCVWIKGQTSGQFQRVRSIRLDCDGDALLFEVDQEGSGACHTGARTCFHRKLEA